ncbi:hypothetical protein MY11210_001268 [Beauveria gryllotalpidicola]
MHLANPCPLLPLFNPATRIHADEARANMKTAAAIVVQYLCSLATGLAE